MGTRHKRNSGNQCLSLADCVFKEAKIMNSKKRFFEKASNIVVGLLLAGAGLIAILLDFSFLPLIGVFIGIPAIYIGVLFIAKSGRKPGHEKRKAGKWAIGGMRFSEHHRDS